MQISLYVHLPYFLNRFFSNDKFIVFNDVVYVKPNRFKAANAEINQNRSFWISIVSTLVSVATLATTIILNTRK